ncbi:hypothetical protein M141_3912 [Bacteroides fragilis str. S38L5]|nr:hypothetical protein M070_3903 [Bacteroides fragilis str. A7 (UDC12-2)]EYA94135.1 hypothetical protein M141_3912 [Bacteroides fragilis str. S38L5]KXU50871.1 hypothetical protein HMPREF2530_00244 [Bacteroides fragilis]KXU50901.1 hypothetical protein HMPREF2533_00244 [Bacteroides fragilis]
MLALIKFTFKVLIFHLFLHRQTLSLRGVFIEKFEMGNIQ